MIVALVGMAGSGKTLVSYNLEKRGFKRIRFGDITDDHLERKGLDNTEENERKIRESLRKEYGMAAYAKLNLPKIQEHKGKVVIDGLYSYEEYEFLKEKLGDKLFLVAVYSSPETRYERLVERSERSLTKEQARIRDKTELENLNKAAPIAMADYTLLNVGTLYDLENNIDELIEWLEDETKLG